MSLVTSNLHVKKTSISKWLECHVEAHRWWWKLAHQLRLNSFQVPSWKAVCKGRSETTRIQVISSKHPVGLTMCMRLTFLSAWGRTFIANNRNCGTCQCSILCWSTLKEFSGHIKAAFAHHLDRSSNFLPCDLPFWREVTSADQVQEAMRRPPVINLKYQLRWKQSSGAREDDIEGEVSQVWMIHLWMLSTGHFTIWFIISLKALVVTIATVERCTVYLLVCMSMIQTNIVITGRLMRGHRAAG